VLPWLVAAVTLGLRLLTAANGPTDWDSAQYAAAVGRYDVTHGRPQPPGYWLYVVSGRFLHQVTGVGTIHCLVLVAALASAAAAGMTVVAGRDLGGWWVGLAAGAVVATSPFAWFNGSIVATYSFDLLAGPLLMVLAWRARPGSWHGVGAVIALGLLSGFRQSVVQSFAVLALVAVVASTRRWSDWLKVVLAGAAAVAAWLVPMALSQPGGLTAWARATRLESDGAAQATSVFDHGAASLNFGTFAGYTVTALAPVVVLTLLAAVALGLRALPSERGPGTQADGDPVDPGRGGGDPGGRRGGGSDTAHWIRPWYQWRITILTAAILPPVLLVTLVQFAKGGYLLAYLPGAVIALLLPLGALNRTSSPGRRASAPWVVATSVGVVLVVALGSQRFVAGAGVLPQRLLHTSGGLWLTDPRYQAPYADTRAAIRAADSVDAALAALGPSLQAGRDVVVLDDLDGGLNIYRNAGWALPDDRVALIAPGALIYNQLGGSLYYARGDTVAVGPSGSAFLIAAPTLPGLASLVVEGAALPVTTPRPIGGFRVYQVIPGSSVLGVRVVAQPGPRPLGRGI
jgi:hypothetical protein